MLSLKRFPCSVQKERGGKENSTIASRLMIIEILHALDLEKLQSRAFLHRNIE